MVPAIEGRKVGVGEIPEGYKPIRKEGNRTYYEKITETSEPESSTKTAGGQNFMWVDVPKKKKKKTKIVAKTPYGTLVPSKKPIPPVKAQIPGSKSKQRDVLYTEEAEGVTPPAAKPSPIKAFVGEHIFNPNQHAIGAVINVSRESADAARESGLVNSDQEDVFVKYIPGTAKPDLNNVYRMPKGIISKITGGTIKIQSQEGMDLLEKYKVDPKSVESFKNRLTWTNPL